MKSLPLALAALASLVSLDANAYWVRPVLVDETGFFQDGLDIDGDVIKQVQFTDAARAGRARVDLTYGEVGVYSRLGQDSLPIDGDETLVANALFGETITFNSEAADVWDFGLDVDGYVYGDVENPYGSATPRMYMKASIAIFAGYTSNPLTWATAENMAKALFYDEIDYEFGGNGFVDESVYDGIYGSLDIQPGDSFDIIVRMWGWCGIGANAPGYCEVDFGNTGTFRIDNDVSTFTSTSGSFLGSEQTVVPAPAGVWLLGTALAGLGVRRWRQRS